MSIIALIYRYGPDRDEPKWKWVFPGVIVATILWIVGSILFTCLCLSLRKLQQDLRLVERASGLLIWMWLSAFAVLFGAEVNGEAERQARGNTTKRFVAEAR